MTTRPVISLPTMNCRSINHASRAVCKHDPRKHEPRRVKRETRFSETHFNRLKAIWEKHATAHKSEQVGISTQQEKLWSCFQLSQRWCKAALLRHRHTLAASTCICRQRLRDKNKQKHNKQEVTQSLLSFPGKLRQEETVHTRATAGRWRVRIKKKKHVNAN